MLDEEELTGFTLNKRKYDRYPVKAIPIEDIGDIIELSRNGLRVQKKTAEPTIKETDETPEEEEEEAITELTIPLSGKQLKAHIVWQDEKHMGLRFAAELEDCQIIKDKTRKIQDFEIKPARVITDKEIMAVTKKDLLSSFINLMAELETPETNLNKLKIYIEDINSVCEETFGRKKRPSKTEGEEEETEGETEEEEEESKDVDEDEEGELTEADEEALAVAEIESRAVKPSDIKDLLIHEANNAYSSMGVRITELDFALQRLGLKSVKEICSDYLRKRISQLKLSLTGFTNYESYNILKTVIFLHLKSFFGFTDELGEESLLLSIETKGIEILTDLSGKDSENLKNYYISPRRVYSGISREYENKHFGRDLLMVNKFYFKNNLKRFDDVYDGYILAHFNSNPSYSLESDTKISLNKKRLTFSFLAYLAFLTTKFVMNRDKESGYVLINILTRTGADTGRIVKFLNEGIAEANMVLKDLGLKGNIRRVAAPSSPVKIRAYLPKNTHYEYLMRSFEYLDRLKNINRVAIRYEDTTYTHIVLSRLMHVKDFGLDSKAYCTIPCANISDDVIYIEDFSFFDLIILKDIDKLPSSHLKYFIKLWESFEGQIIATFSKYSYLDIDNQELYGLLKDHIVDFPSYFSNKETYEKMLEHTAGYMKPFIGENDIDTRKYSNAFFLMDFIKSNELKSYC